MKMLLVALLSLAGISLAHAQASAPDATPSARDQHAAVCVAALEVSTEDLAKEVKAGKEASRPLLLDRLISGTSFVGDVYLHGLGDEKQARALADRALEDQKRLTPAELAARQLVCAAEGAKLYSDSNGLERVIVKRLANKRMDKLLRD